jgi:hypothetical protein
MTRPSNENLKKLLAMTREMLVLADEGDRDREDASCGILFGILRDSAYKLRQLAESECRKHAEEGRWDGRSPGGDGRR